MQELRVTKWGHFSRKHLKIRSNRCVYTPIDRPEYTVRPRFVDLPLEISVTHLAVFINAAQSDYEEKKEHLNISFFVFYIFGVLTTLHQCDKGNNSSTNLDLNTRIFLSAYIDCS